MHEYSMTVKIVKTILEEARKHKAKRILNVTLEIGELTFLNAEQFRFWYRILTKDTCMEKSKVHINKKPGIIKCSICEYEGELGYKKDETLIIPQPIFLCPKCNSLVQITGGKECLIKNVRIVT